MRKLAGTGALIGGLCLIYLGGYDGGLEGVVQRFIFFCVAAVLVVAGFEKWALRSLPVWLRIISVLLVAGAALLAVSTAVTFALISPAVALIIAAFGRRFLTRAPIPTSCGVAGVLFAAYRAYSPYGWDGAAAAIIPIAVLATFCAFAIGRQPAAPTATAEPAKP